jgi:hypothetical protein
VGFDAASDITGTYGDNSGTLSGTVAPVLDTSVRASGASSLKFTIPSNSGAGASGSYFTNFSPDLSVQFGGNEEFYIQWRQRFSAEFLATRFDGGGGWKHVIIGTGDQPSQLYASCTALETVVQNTNQRGFAQMYNSCSGSTSHGPYQPFEESFGSFDFKLQNARSSPYCLYSQGQTNPKTFFPPSGNCLGYFADEWMTFQVMIRTGPRVGDEFVDSFVSLWVARQNQPSEQVLEWGPYNLTAGSPGSNQRFGKIWLLPYHTGKSASQSHPTGYTWYDELIISHNRIGDPTAGSSTPPSSSDTTRPSAPGGLDATAASATRINLSWSASTDNVGVTGYRVLRDGAHIGTSTATSYADMALAADTSYTYRVTAVDAAGNVSLESTTASATTASAPPPPPAPSPSPPPSSGTLAQVAANMAPGSWAQLSAPANFNLFAQGSITGNILPYANSMPWDPINKKIHILGMDHGAPEIVYLQYNATTHSFAQMPGPGNASHGNDHNALNPVTGDLYHRVYGFAPAGVSVKKRSNSSGSWSQLPNWSGMAQVAIGATWWSGSFAGAGAQGALVLFNSGNATGGASDGQIVAYNPLNNSWFFNKTGVAPNASSGSTYHSVIEYSPKKNVAVYGGGNAYTKRLWRLNADGSTTPMPNTPGSTEVGIQHGNLVNDPVTGNFLLLSAGQLWVLNPSGSGSWTQQSGTRAPPAGVGIPGPSQLDSVISTAIDTYGVVAYITFRGRSGNFFLYKHAQ